MRWNNSVHKTRAVTRLRRLWGYHRIDKADGSFWVHFEFVRRSTVYRTGSIRTSGTGTHIRIRATKCRVLRSSVFLIKLEVFCNFSCREPGKCRIVPDCRMNAYGYVYTKNRGKLPLFNGLFNCPIRQIYPSFRNQSDEHLYETSCRHESLLTELNFSVEWFLISLTLTQRRSATVVANTVLFWNYR